MSKKLTTSKQSSRRSPSVSDPVPPADLPVPVPAGPTLIDINLPGEPSPTPREIANRPLETPTSVAVAEPPPAKMPDPAEHREQAFDEPDPLTPPPPATMADHIDDTVETLAAVEPELGDHDVHPNIKLPMMLIRDKKRMVRYAQAIGRNPVEAQSRREKLKLTPQVMFLYRHYKKYCEKHGMRYWTERGFAATLVCFYRGVPLEEPEQEPEQDILGRISEGISREQARR